MVLRDEEVSREHRPLNWWPQLGWLDCICLAVIGVLLVTLCVERSRSRLFWADETFGYTLLRDPELAHTLRGWWEGADGGGVLYYLTGHVWFRLFGASPLVLRMLSTTSFLAGIVMIWIMARRFFVAPIVAIATGLAFFLPSYIIWQETNGRFYGLFLASAAATAACTMHATELRGHSRALLWLTFCTHGCLVGSHILGLVYSVGLLTALVLLDVLEHRRRFALYASVLMAWLLVLPISLHAIRAATMIAQGVFWPTRPRLRDLLFGFFAYSHKLIALAAVLLLVAIVRLARRGAQPLGSAHVERARHSIAVVVGGLVLAQLALFVKSRVGLSIYSDRYLLPLVIAIVLLFCEGLTFAFGARLVSKISRPLPALAVTLVSLGALFAVGARGHTYDLLYPRLGYPARIERMLPPGRNVVVSFLPTFMLLRLTDPGHNYIFVTDWSYDGRTPGLDLSGQRMMENFERGGFTPDQVLDLPALLQERPEFTLLAEPGRLPWLKDRFERNGEFEVIAAGELEEWYPITIWRIRCRQPQAGCRPSLIPIK